MPNHTQSKKNKIFVLLPDGVGLRNFAYTDFHKTGIDRGNQITFWNNTPFNLTEMGFDEISIAESRSHPMTELYKNARKQIELNLNKRRNNDPVYDSYRFTPSYKTIKAAAKNNFVRLLTFFNSSEKGLRQIRAKLQNYERRTTYYSQCLEKLRVEQPDVVFCTNQRPMSAIAPILAAQELGIPTATFIFSWDNLPKATMLIEPDFYFVWSELMKQQLLSYYPYVKDEQIIITGTPQFEPHLDKSLLLSKSDFFKNHGLDPAKKYICYSGDDITTSPNDPKYLDDVCSAVRELNASGEYDLGIIFRRCPVDFSKRFDEVLSKNSDLITPIAPQWKKIGERWNTVFPTKEDLALQMNTIAHTEMVINLGSSMVFDYASFGKPCAFMNYDYPIEKAIRKDWSVKKTYNFVHFRSMPSQDAVLWLDDASDIANQIAKALQYGNTTVAAAKNWFQKINMHPVDQASERIFTAFDKVIAEGKSSQKQKNPTQ